jgi:hypothetical protein
VKTKHKNLLIEGHCAKYLTCTSSYILLPQTCQGHHKQGKTEELVKRNLRSIIITCNVVSWNIKGHWEKLGESE